MKGALDLSQIIETVFNNPDNHPGMSLSPVILFVGFLCHFLAYSSDRAYQSFFCDVVYLKICSKALNIRPGRSFGCKDAKLRLSRNRDLKVSRIEDL